MASELVRLSIGAPVSEAVSEPSAPPVAVRLVLQRAVSSRILLNADSSTEETVETGAALIAYVSFTAEMERCAKPEQARRIEQAGRFRPPSILVCRTVHMLHTTGAALRPQLGVRGCRRQGASTLWGLLPEGVVSTQRFFSL